VWRPCGSQAWRRYALYIPELLVDVLAGRLDPSPVLDLIVDLAGVPEGYRAMDTRKAIKVMVKM